jgi:hypothetical protein
VGPRPADAAELQVVRVLAEVDELDDLRADRDPLPREDEWNSRAATWTRAGGGGGAAIGIGPM